MDIRSLARFRALLKLGAILLLLLSFRPGRQALAQAGACPDNTYLLGQVGGWWPSDLSVCTHYQPETYIEESQTWYPCEQYLAITDAGFYGDIYEEGYGHPVVIVPDAATYYGQLARIQALVFGRPSFLGPDQTLIPPGIILSNVDVEVMYFSSSGNLYYTSGLIDLDNFTRVYTWYDSGATGINNYYVVYLLDLTLPTSEGSGGYFWVRLYYNDRPLGIQVKHNWGLSSVRIGSNDDYMPGHCSIPNANLPATPAPATPTGTPVPTWTPHSTPTPLTTPGPTADLGTLIPTGTPTTWYFPTIVAEATPTPWPPFVMPTIAYPTAPPVVVAAAATVTNTTGGLGNLAATIDAQWADNQTFAAGTFDTTITGTTGIAPADSLLQNLTGYIAQPVSYFKLLPAYLPNAWPYLRAFLYFVGWILFNIIGLLMFRLLVFLWRVIVSIKEAIPIIG